MTFSVVNERPLPPIRVDRREIAGSLGDLGTLVPLAVLLITSNGLNPTVVIGVVGLVYMLSGLYYRIPMPVQPLKSFSALAIAGGLGPSVISAGTMLMAVSLLVLGITGAADWIARCVPKILVRGIQLGVGVILIRVGLRLCFEPIAGAEIWLPATLAVATILVILIFARNRTFPAGLLVVGGGLLAGLVLIGLPPIALGPVIPRMELPSAGDFWKAAILLVLPQLPLTLTNSLAATQDAAQSYFGASSRRVTGRALAIGMGIANLVAGLFGGMPVCHGSGGVTAHYRFGARTGGAGIFLGAVLLFLAVGFGPTIAGFCKMIPPPVLGALLVYVGAAHCLLIRDVAGGWAWVIVLVTGGVGGILNHNGYGLAAGLAVLAARWVVQRCRPWQRGVRCAEAVANAEREVIAMAVYEPGAGLLEARED